MDLFKGKGKFNRQGKHLKVKWDPNFKNQWHINKNINAHCISFHATVPKCLTE